MSASDATLQPSESQKAQPRYEQSLLCFMVSTMGAPRGRMPPEPPCDDGLKTPVGQRPKLTRSLSFDEIRKSLEDKKNPPKSLKQLLERNAQAPHNAAPSRITAEEVSVSKEEMLAMLRDAGEDLVLHNPNLPVSQMHPSFSLTVDPASSKLHVLSASSPNFQYSMDDEDDDDFSEVDWRTAKNASIASPPLSKKEAAPSSVSGNGRLDRAGSMHSTKSKKEKNKKIKLRPSDLGLTEAECKDPIKFATALKKWKAAQQNEETSPTKERGRDRLSRELSRSSSSRSVRSKSASRRSSTSSQSVNDSSTHSRSTRRSSITSTTSSNPNSPGRSRSKSRSRLRSESTTASPSPARPITRRSRSMSRGRPFPQLPDMNESSERSERKQPAHSRSKSRPRAAEPSLPSRSTRQSREEVSPRGRGRSAVRKAPTGERTSRDHASSRGRSRGRAAPHAAEEAKRLPRDKSRTRGEEAGRAARRSRSRDVRRDAEKVDDSKRRSRSMDMRPKSSSAEGRSRARSKSRSRRASNEREAPSTPTSRSRLRRKGDIMVEGSPSSSHSRRVRNDPDAASPIRRVRSDSNESEPSPPTPLKRPSMSSVTETEPAVPRGMPLKEPSMGSVTGNEPGRREMPLKEPSFSGSVQSTQSTATIQAGNGRRRTPLRDTSFASSVGSTQTAPAASGRRPAPLRQPSGNNDMFKSAGSIPEEEDEEAPMTPRTKSGLGSRIASLKSAFMGNKSSNLDSPSVVSAPAYSPTGGSPRSRYLQAKKLAREAATQPSSPKTERAAPVLARRGSATSSAQPTGESSVETPTKKAPPVTRPRTHRRMSNGSQSVEWSEVDFSTHAADKSVHGVVVRRRSDLSEVTFDMTGSGHADDRSKKTANLNDDDVLSKLRKAGITTSQLNKLKAAGLSISEE